MIYVDSVVREDANEGQCSFEDVSSSRFRTVKNKMLYTVNTNPPWDVYHAFERNSVMWAGEVWGL